MKNKAKKIQIKKFFSGNLIFVLLLALVPTIIIVLINPIDFKKYQVKLNYTRLNKNAVHVYEDLDNDGKEEYINMNNFTMATLGMLIYTSDREHTGQYNSQYYMPVIIGGNKIFCEDINNDSVKEIIYFSQKSDSLFLSIFNYKNLNFLLKERFITIIGLNEKTDYSYYWLTSADINQDQLKEIYFSVIGNFALYPRKIFKYDFANDSLISSVDAGAKQNVKSFYTDSGEPFFLSGSRATDNCYEDFPFEYRDTCTWFFAYDKDLKLIIKPRCFLGKPSSINDIYKQGKNFIALYTNSGTSGAGSKILYLNMQGAITDSVIISEKFINETFIKINIGKKEHFFIYSVNNDQVKYYEYFPDKRNYKQTNLSKKLTGYLRPYMFDIDKDNEEEYFLINFSDKSLYLYRNNLKNPVKIPVDSDFEGIIDISSKVTDNVIKLIITTKSKFYFLDYFRNPNYWYKYPFWILIYFLSIFFVWLVQLIPKRIERKQDELKNKIINLQLTNTQNQLDPHFTFNALNVVASKIYKEDRNTAYDLFERFSRLMRSSLAFSDKIFRPLSDELQFTEDYLEFQKSRFKTLFDFKITVLEEIEIDKIQIPKMLIQGFAENCVKHAFKGIDYKCKINIEVAEKDDKTLITIEDNGIGIKQSHIDNPVPESGRGMIAMQEQVSLINKLYKKEILIEITDKSKTNKQLSGTLILIQI